MFYYTNWKTNEFLCINTFLIIHLLQNINKLIKKTAQQKQNGGYIINHHNQFLKSHWSIIIKKVIINTTAKLIKQYVIHFETIENSELYWNISRLTKYNKTLETKSILVISIL